MTMNMLYGDYGTWAYPVLIILSIALVVSGSKADMNRIARSGHVPGRWCSRCDAECRAPLDGASHGLRTLGGAALFVLIAPLYCLGLLLIALT